ncbi:MAG: cadherin-like domain-containing protein, partial [Planctomycetales bacterium]|nr:cadherin-like domain-containing protein [Planctomycetales bacterium]
MRRKFQSEPLEARCLLAGDLVAHWNADTFAADAESWLDSVGGVAAGVFGQPSLAAAEINGRSVVSLDAADGVDGFRIAVSDSPMSNAADYSLVVVFRTDATTFNGGANSNWYEATGLVDGNALGFSQDWGMTINGDGRIMTGLGGGFLSPSTTVVGTNSLNDGQLQVAVVTKQGAELSIYENGQLTGSAIHINADARYSSSMTIGMVNGTNTNGFTGQIGQVLIYDGALDASEVQSLQSEWEAYYNNAQPVAMGDTYTLTEDQGLFFQTALNGVLANDSDADGDTLTAVLVTPPEHGTFSLNADGGFIYG